MFERKVNIIYKMKQFTPLFLQSIMMMKYENSLNEDDQAKTHFSSNFIDIIWGTLLPVVWSKRNIIICLFSVLLMILCGVIITVEINPTRAVCNIYKNIKVT